MEDNGQRREFATGAVRDVVDGKGWYAGISPIALRRLALVLQKGAAKYQPRNWEKGIPLNASFDSAIRHLMQWANGETDEDHLGHAMCNVMFLIHIEQKIVDRQLPRELGDMGVLASGLELLDLDTKEQLRSFLKKPPADVPGLLGEK